MLNYNEGSREGRALSDQIPLTMTNSLLWCMYICVFFICSFFIIKQINSAFYLWKVKSLRGSSLHLGPTIWELSPNYETHFLFSSCLHASFPWFSCYCILGAYIETILSIRYLTAWLLCRFYRNAGAWVFSGSFAVNGLISYPLFYLVLLVYFFTWTTLYF